MIDMFGNTVNIGDTVVFGVRVKVPSHVRTITVRSSLTSGKVQKLRAKDTQAVVEIAPGHHVYLKEQELLKYTI